MHWHVSVFQHDEHNELELRCKNTENKLKDALESISYKDTLLAQMKDQSEQMFRKDEEVSLRNVIIL